MRAAATLAALLLAASLAGCESRCARAAKSACPVLVKEQCEKGCLRSSKSLESVGIEGHNCGRKCGDPLRLLGETEACVARETLSCEKGAR